MAGFLGAESGVRQLQGRGPPLDTLRVGFGNGLPNICIDIDARAASS